MSNVVNPDFSQEVVPPKPGIYRAKILSTDQRFSQSGDPMLVWVLEFSTPVGNFRTNHRTMLAGKGVGFFRRFIEAVDPSYQSGAVDVDKLVGKTLRVSMVDDIDRRTGQKTGYLKVDEALPDDSGNAFPSDESQPSFTEDDIPF